MANFTVPKNIIIGKGIIKEAQTLLTSYGKKAFIVTGKHVVKSTMMDELKELLDECKVQYYIFDEITGEPTIAMVEEGVKSYKENSCDYLIGIGGGSPIDAAKAIGVMISSTCSISDYKGKMIEVKLPPIVAIPTTAGTGSEATKFTVITDSENDIKMLLKGDTLLPDLAIVDYTFGITAPQSVTVATGLDALTHAIEAYTSKKAFALTDALAISAIRRIMKSLPIVYKDGSNEEARGEMAVAALEAGICINNSSVTLVHGMSRPIGALFHVPHGISNAMLLTRCLDFAKDGAIEKFATLAKSIGVAVEEDESETAADKFLLKVKELCDICDVPTLREYGINEEKYFSLIDKMAKDAIDSGSPANTMRLVTEEDCKAIYKKVF